MIVPETILTKASRSQRAFTGRNVGGDRGDAAYAQANVAFVGWIVGPKQRGWLGQNL